MERSDVNYVLGFCGGRIATSREVIRLKRTLFTWIPTNTSVVVWKVNQ